MHHPAPVVWNLTKKIPLNYTDYHCSISYKTAWLRELRRKSTKLYHFGGPWVRIQAQTENVSVIFFCKDFSRFSYLKLASDIFGGVHKQCGLSKGRERGCCTTYVIIQFDVPHLFRIYVVKILKFRKIYFLYFFVPPHKKFASAHPERLYS